MSHINIISNKNSPFEKYYSIYKNKILPNKNNLILKTNLGILIAKVGYIQFPDNSKLINKIKSQLEINEIEYNKYLIGNYVDKYEYNDYIDMLDYIFGIIIGIFVWVLWMIWLGYIIFYLIYFY